MGIWVYMLFIRDVTENLGVFDPPIVLDKKTFATLCMRSVTIMAMNS